MRAPFLSVGFANAVEPANFTAESARRGGRGYKTILKAESVRHTSTKFLLVWKTSAGIFPRTPIQHWNSWTVKCRDSNCRGEGAEFAVNPTSRKSGETWARNFLLLSSTFRRPVGRNPRADLYLQFALRPTNESGAAIFHAQAYIPTQPAQAIEEARLSRAHEDPGRPESSVAPPRQGAQAGLGEARFS